MLIFFFQLTTLCYLQCVTHVNSLSGREKSGTTTLIILIFMLHSQHCNVSGFQFFRLVRSLYFPPGSCLSNNKIKPPCCVSDSLGLFVYLFTWCVCRNLALTPYWSSSSWVITVGQTPTPPERVSLLYLSHIHTHAHAHTHTHFYLSPEEL